MVNMIAAILLVIFCHAKSEDTSCLPCTCHRNNYGFKLNCSALDLPNIPFFLSSSFTSLHYGRNKIRVIKKGAFQHLINLRYLDLSCNNISAIERDAFRGLSSLEVLHLDGNPLLSVQGDQYYVFTHLNHLRIMFLNDTGISGPHISELISLQELYVDYRECNINHTISNILSIVSVTFTNCEIRRLTNDTFDMFPSLQSLSLTDCGIEHIEAGSFEPLTKLRSLDLSMNRNLGFKALSKGFYGLRNSPLQSLNLNLITAIISHVAPVDKYTFQYLSNTALEELHLDGNVVSYVEKGTIEALPKTIKVISTKYCLAGDVNVENFTGVYLLKSLQTVDVTGRITWDPGSGQSKPWHYADLPRMLPFPSNLQILNIASSYFRTDFGEHVLFPPNTLKTLIAKDNLITSFIGPFTGADSISYIDLSSNILYKFGPNVFSHNNSLKFVNVSNNNLGKCFEDDMRGNIFANAGLLEVLDISNNRITFLPRLFLKGLRKIEFLNISNNVIFTFRVSLSHMTNLRHLDLSNNRLQLLSVDVQNELDVLKKTVVNLKANPFACSCHSLQFLRWAKIRHELIQGLNNMTCILPNGTRVGLDDIENTVSELEKQCSSNVVLITVTTSSIMCALVVVGVIAGYRNRWKLRYLYHVGRRGYQVLNEDDGVDYRYDAFVSYADEDRGFVINTLIPELEQKSGLKLCIHHRDFLPGAVITENVVTSIQNSRKTLLVLSPAFLKSEWCSYEFNMALVDGISRKQNIIVTVLYKQVQLKNVPKDLAVMLSNNSYLEYNTDLHGGVVFWNNLVESINTTQPIH